MCGFVLGLSIMFCPHFVHLSCYFVFIEVLRSGRARFVFLFQDYGDFLGPLYFWVIVEQA